MDGDGPALVQAVREPRRRNRRPRRWLRGLALLMLACVLLSVLQVVALRHAHAADAAIVLSSETVFTAVAGALFMGDRMGATGVAGCGLILACVLLVQLQPIVWRWFAESRARSA